ncbi:hypothetical protein BTA51_19895 [Hahella sp. CCB-MM4]|uniref:hypothetical protein n=1 Tax=Hahella sp. (strain CCB-MM4) TaxID=1926491 RepID=UPI000B9BAC3C|nr:hypothetical protein [Hahella sp. CCB-MM4]OZG71549.1 hypothetical protein BTA51_19895 [Hahella sp. CCB-MM4]
MTKLTALLLWIMLSAVRTTSATVVEISPELSSPAMEDTFSLYYSMPESMPEQGVEAANSLTAFDSEVEYDPVHLILTGYNFNNAIEEPRINPDDDSVGSPKDSLWQEVVNDTVGFSQSADFLPELKDSNEFVFLSLEFATFRAATDIGIFLDIFDPFMYLRSTWGGYMRRDRESFSHRIGLELDSNANLPEPENLSLLLLAIALFLLRARYISLR